MCRLLAYSGKPVWLDSLLIEPEASLVSQSMAAREAKTVVNGDGCGLGWYGERGTPGVFRDTRPAWSDANLAALCHQLRSGMFMAHVRSATSGEVSRANCHPFSHGQYLFMHNGQIGGYEQIRRDIDSSFPTISMHPGAAPATAKRSSSSPPASASMPIRCAPFPPPFASVRKR